MTSHTDSTNSNQTELLRAVWGAAYAYGIRATESAAASFESGDSYTLRSTQEATRYKQPAYQRGQESCRRRSGAKTCHARLSRP
jgi:hypothetical protein